MELPMEEWLHVALTWDSGNYVVYVNGEEVANGAYTGLSTIHPIANIGNDGSSAPYEAFAGLLDEVRLYDHALNADEILAAMKSAAYPQASGPNPKEGALLLDTWANLEWRAGDFAVSHDIYIGDNFDDVNIDSGSMVDIANLGQYGAYASKFGIGPDSFSYPGFCLRYAWHFTKFTLLIKLD